MRLILLVLASMSFAGCVSIYTCNDQIKQSYDLGKQHGRASCINSASNFPSHEWTTDEESFCKMNFKEFCYAPSNG